MFSKILGCPFVADIKNHVYSYKKVALDYVILLHKSAPGNPDGWCNPDEFGLSTSLCLLGSYHILCNPKTFYGHFNFSCCNWCPIIHCESYHKVQCDLFYKSIIFPKISGREIMVAVQVKGNGTNDGHLKDLSPTILAIKGEVGVVITKGTR